MFYSHKIKKKNLHITASHPSTSKISPNSSPHRPPPPLKTSTHSPESIPHTLSHRPQTFQQNPSPDIAIYVKNAKSFTKFALTNFTHKQDHNLKQSTTMNDYDNDYTDDMYDRYMLTGEGAEYFEDFEDITEEDNEDDDVEEVNINQTQTEITETEAPEYVDINKQLDEIIRILKRQLKEKERLLKHQNMKTTQKKKTTQNNRPKQKKKPSTENR